MRTLMIAPALLIGALLLAAVGTAVGRDVRQMIELACMTLIAVALSALCIMGLRRLAAVRRRRATAGPVSTLIFPPQSKVQMPREWRRR